jgi:lysophospholipase L1-like esterase
MESTNIKIVSYKCSKRKNKILILGDSHSRGIANELQQHVGEDSIVQALIKPGANIEAILRQKDLAIAKLAKQDVCIIWGGTQDISRNESNQGLQQLKEFIDKHQNTNIIFIEAPHRYDLKADSSVNEETRIFKRKLKSLSEQDANLCVIEISITREVYTRHGLHMNRKGKEQTARKIATEIGKLIEGNKKKSVAQPCELVVSREENLVGVVKVISVSDTEAVKVNPQEIPN